MGDSHSIINLGDFAKPANTLIEKISDAIGGVFKPYQITRVAQAEARADLIRTSTQIEVTELQRRAMRRFIMEEAKKQNNIETITAKALPEINEQARPELVEDDWIVNFFDKCRLISDEDMQTLWARLLAGEANSPGKFSKRTIDLLGSMDKSDATLFSQLCSFGFTLGRIYPLVYEVTDAIYLQNGITFENISHLDSIGLISFGALGYNLGGLKQKGFCQYFGVQVWIEFPQTGKHELNLGKVLLTQAGQQLAPLCGAHPLEGFVEYVREKWKGFGYKVEREAEKDNTEPSASAASEA